MTRRAAFTLLEILLATALTAVLVTTLLLAVTRLTEAQARATGPLEASAFARPALDTLAADLACLPGAPPGNTPVLHAAFNEDGSLRELRLLRLRADGLPVAVRYALQEEAPETGTRAAPGTLFLYRTQADPAATMTSLQANLATAAPALFGPLDTPAKRRAAYLAPYVAALTLHFHDAAGTLLKPSAGDTLAFPAYDLSSGLLLAARPARVEIALTVQPPAPAPRETVRTATALP